LSSLKETEKSEDLRNIIDLFINFSINLKFLNENQYKKFESLKREFYLKFNEILEEDDGSKKNYVYIDAFLPILQLMELKESKNDKDTDVFKKLTDQFDMLKQKRKKKKSLQANSK
jgi:hypothetical protein